MAYVLDNPRPTGYTEVMADTRVTVLLDRQHFGPLVTLSDGASFPKWVEAWAKVDGTAVTLWLAVHEGRPVLRRLAVQHSDDSPLLASTVHGLPVEAIVRQAIADIGDLLQRVGVNSSPIASRHRRITDALLREVADAVRNDPLGMPNQAVQRAIPCSSRTASRYITAARQRGFLESEES
jgi:hypothetical protein